MKIKSILALTVFSLYTGITNYANAQDTKLSFFPYLFKTPWLVDAGVSHVSNDGKPDPFNANFKMKPYYNTERVNYYPSRFAVEKPLWAFSERRYLRGFSLQAVLSRHGLQPINFAAIDGNVKYHFNVFLNDESKLKKWFDPYASVGLGVSDFFYDKIDSVRAKNGTAPVYKKGYEQYPVAQHFSRDRFITMNLGVGSTFWINRFVGINIQADAKWGKFIERDIRNNKQEGTNYMQYTAGLVFKIGGCKKVVEEPKEEVKPASNYKRSKEEEDALIHLREHLNK
jgi:hypothetical protein